MKFSKLFFLLVMSLCIASCAKNENTKSDIASTTVMEVTTFRINPDTDPTAFAVLDAQVESNFTVKQPGFINRQSGVDDTGNYVVVVFWENTANAEASMGQFMSDTSVADYAQMIDAPTMKMSRYSMENPFNAESSRFVEIMSFDVTKDIDMAKFNTLNQRVETDFTGKRKGFVQRLTGTDDAGKQVVAVYWASKETSDAALQPFMEAPIAKEFMQGMEQASIAMGRYKFLTN